MALPKKLRNFNLFGDGENWVGQIEEVVLPKLSRKVEEYTGSGMDGAIEIDMGQEKLELEWTAGGLMPDVFNGYGTLKIDDNMLRFNGAYVSDETAETIPVEIVVRGRHREIDMGTAKNGDNNQVKVMTSCTYYKLSIAGATKIEIDVPGYKFLVNGVDRLAEQRQAIGL
ncbi:phage major tail tube protein [gamma proteobacterium HTCC5015]|nr:phage major tail tube protein [gamma proteobacterium HTCC5015]